MDRYLKIYAANIEIMKVMQEEDWAEWMPLLDCTRREKIGRLKQKKDRAQSLGAGLLLRYSFLQEGYTKEQWANVTIQCEPLGKPRIVQDPEFCYSLSHSGDWVICGVYSKELGADIQEMQPWKQNIAKRCFAVEEYERILQAEEAEKQPMFYRMWTAKESYGKLTGDGIGKGISHYLTTESFDRVKDTKCHTEARIKIYETLPGYMVCICARECDTFPNDIEIISVNDLK